MKTIIEAKDLVRTYISGERKINAVDHVSFKLEEGEFLAITGRSGSGKSTLMYQLGLLDRPTSGSITIDGVNVLELSENERTFLRLSELGYVFQDYAILPALTALENVMIPLLALGFDSTTSRAKARKSLDRVDLEHRMDNYPSQLSGGEQQRVAIARALAHEPKIIFADEPTANLDSETSKVVLDAFLDLHKKEGQTIVMVTHEKEYAALSDRIIHLDDGKVVSDNKHRKN